MAGLETPGAQEEQASLPSPPELRGKLFDWYLNTGPRGCVFNRIAAQRAQKGQLPWLTPVEYAGIEDTMDGEAGPRVLESFEKAIEADEPEGLVSYMFPSLKGPNDYANLLLFLSRSNPDRFEIEPDEDIDKLGPSGRVEDFVGVRFRINLGHTDSGEKVQALPIIYTPDEFTTFARRFEVFTITFKRGSSKSNPTTPETAIGPDDFQHDIGEPAFGHLLKRSIAIRLDAHATDGTAQPGNQFSRTLFRARNALVLPLSDWEQAQAA